MIITSDVVLPCGGNPSAGIPENIIIRSATVSEWKSIISSSSKKYKYVALWKLCDNTPGYIPDLEIDKLLSPIDITQLMIYSRIVTIGPEIEINVKCPRCGYKNTIKLDLSTIEYTDNDGINKYDMEINYPRAESYEKLSIRLKVNTESEIRNVAEKAEKVLETRKKQNPKYDMDIIDVIAELLPYARVESINGNKVNLDYILDIYPNISVSDYDEIEYQGNYLNDKVHAKKKSTVCSVCSNNINYDIPRGRDILLYKRSK